MERVRFIITLACLGCSAVSPTLAQAVLSGRVLSNGVPVPYANVGIRGTTFGTAAAEDGRYRIAEVPPGSYAVVASAVGYATKQAEVVLEDGQEIVLDFHLEESIVESEGVVITGTMKETFVSESPVKVEVISSRYLSKIPTANVMEVIGNVNGLYQQIDCGVCYTNNIRINGMEGPYMAVLIDGMPVMSALATVYGLNGINPSLIQQIEVIKGPVSTLYGTEAMAGVINIITKRPEVVPRFATGAFVTSDGEASLDFAAAPAAEGRTSVLLSGSTFYMDRRLDENGDGFTDVPLTKRISLFGKAARDDREGRRRLDLSAKYYFEDRFGGVLAWTKPHRGSSDVYGESIYTHRVEVIGTYRIPTAARNLRIDFAANHHDQDSYYGNAPYKARQQVVAANLIWNARRAASQDLLIGSTLRYQSYDDNTPATASAERRLIPGLFAQHESILANGLRVLMGARLDYHEVHGFIFSPRLSTKVTAGENTTFRLNAGTGFRVVNLFTEDHAALTGSRQVVVREDLDPERSYSVTASAQHVIPFGVNPLTIDADVFYTHFTNQILPNYDVDPDLIVYANLDGSAVSRGVSLTLSHSLTTVPLSYTVGATLLDVHRDELGIRSPVKYAPRYQGVANASYHLDRYELTLDYTANLTGPMQLPEYDPPFARPSRSRAFSLHNVQLTRTFALSADLAVDTYVSVENVFDFTQESPLIDPANPFGEHFDTAYVYGPLHGRCFGVGFRLNMP